MSTSEEHHFISCLIAALTVSVDGSAIDVVSSSVGVDLHKHAQLGPGQSGGSKPDAGTAGYYDVISGLDPGFLGHLDPVKTSSGSGKKNGSGSRFLVYKKNLFVSS